MEIFPENQMQFTEIEKEGLYKAIFNRRDVRGEFLPDSINDEVLARILNAAHHAPSVGFMQPWNFIVIRSESVRKQVHEAFLTANEEAAAMFEGERREQYSSLKLEGILETPLNLCITCDRSRGGDVVLGRTAQAEMDLYSTVCAVQNLWLAARVEGVGVGWVSILKPDTLSEILGLPDHVVPIAYLCLGKVTHFNPEPDLEKAGWERRRALASLVNLDRWEGKLPESDGLRCAIEERDGKKMP